MSDLALAAAAGLAAAGALAFFTWLASLVQRDVSLVDRVWSLMIVAPGVAYALVLHAAGPRVGLVGTLAAIWAVRLAAYVTRRNWGHGEDRRYQAIRARNGPAFPLTSLVFVFALQALLAWLVSLPFLAVAAHPREIGVLDVAGAAVVLVGIVFESVGDRQLEAFKADPRSRGRVMDRGLWRLTRHPNYFGEFCVWWGFFLVALPGGWWAVASPLVMSVLLLKVSGVGLLESDIADRRPAYRDYIARTSTFFPWPPKDTAR